MASSASVIRCRAVSAPIVMSVPYMSLSIEPASPTSRRNGCAAATSGSTSPASTSSDSNSGHSSRSRSAPGRLPSPPITTSASTPSSSRLRAAPRRPSRSRNSIHPRLPPRAAPPALDHPPVAVGHRVDVDAVVHRCPHHRADGRVHAPGVAAAGQHRNARERSCRLSHEASERPRTCPVNWSYCDDIRYVSYVPQDNLDALSAHLLFAAEHRKPNRHSNLIEPTFGQSRRRVKVIGRLPGERSCLSLVWAVLGRAAKGWRGLTMTPKALRPLEDLRHAL